MSGRSSIRALCDLLPQGNQGCPSGPAADAAKLTIEAGKKFQEASAQTAALGGLLTLLGAFDPEPETKAAALATGRIAAAGAFVQVGIGSVLRLAGSTYLATKGDATPLVQTSLSIAQSLAEDKVKPTPPFQTPASLEAVVPSGRCP